MSQETTPVYQIVNGERIRKPGDVRDPNRRYGVVCNVQTGEKYLREFTDDEERQADEEAAKWEAEKPIREAEERRQALEAEKFRESLIYEERVVAFLDILGWKEAIKKSVDDAELTKDLGISVNNISKFSEFLDNTRQMLGNSQFTDDPQLTHFSDSILISVKAGKECQRNLLRSLAPIVSQLLNEGLFVRGGIACGKLIHRGIIAYGPALIKAYELEQSAVYPRIVLDQVLSTIWRQGDCYYNEEKLLFMDKNWRIDKDGFRFYDFLQPFMAGHFDNSPKYIETIRLFYEYVRPKIVINLNAYKHDVKVLMKYIWLASYFNEVIAEYTNATLERIEV